MPYLHALINITTMLPKLPQIDLLNIVPDQSDIDVWKVYKIPRKIGCYAFYESDTSQVVYIGSACARNGLQHKMSLYKNPKTKHSTVNRIRAANILTPLLVKIWYCENVGDALKYEADAILKHKPRLNIVWAKTMSKDEYSTKARRRNKIKIKRNKLLRLAAKSVTA